MATRKDSFTEASAFGERAKGAVKDAAGAATGNRSLEREGERENLEGRARQQANSWVTGTFGDRNSAERAFDTLHLSGKAGQIERSRRCRFESLVGFQFELVGLHGGVL